MRRNPSRIRAYGERGRSTESRICRGMCVMGLDSGHADAWDCVQGLAAGVSLAPKKRGFGVGELLRGV